MRTDSFGTRISMAQTGPQIRQFGTYVCLAHPRAGGISVFHQGSDNNGQLWYTYSRDGVNWDRDTLVPNVNMSGSPSAVVYNGLLYVFYQGGSGYAGQLWYAVYDGTNWGQNIVHHVGMSGSPSAEPMPVV
jgi:hypothetical protein